MVLPRLMVKIETKGRYGDVVVFVGISRTSCDGCNSHVARKMVKKVIITEKILYFLLVAVASESIDLALQVYFVVGVEQVTVSVCRT